MASIADASSEARVRETPSNDKPLPWRVTQPPYLPDVKPENVAIFSNGLQIVLPFAPVGRDSVTVEGLVDKAALQAILDREFPGRRLVPAPAVTRFDGAFLKWAFAPFSVGVTMRDVQEKPMVEMRTGHWESPCGPIDFAALATYALDKDDPSAKPKLLLIDYYVDTLEAEIAGEELWGLSKVVGKATSEKEGGRYTKGYTVDGTSHFEMVVEKSGFLMKLLTTKGDVTDTVITRGEPASAKYPQGIPSTENTIRVAGEFSIGLFDPTRDRFTFNRDTPLGQKLEAIKFKPWVKVVAPVMASLYATDAGAVGLKTRPLRDGDVRVIQPAT